MSYYKEALAQQDDGLMQLVNGATGIYQAQSLAHWFGTLLLSGGISQTTIEILMAGPDHADYIETYATVLDTFRLRDDSGRMWALQQDDGGANLWMVCSEESQA